MDDSIRKSLSKALRNVDPHLSRLVSEPETDIRRYQQTFLASHEIYFVVHTGPNRPVSFYVGWESPRQAWLLTGSPENFVRLARADSVVIDSAEEAEQYASAYLEVTRPMSDRFYLVRSVDDIEFRPGLAHDENEAAVALKNSYRSSVQPATAEIADAGYEVTLHAVHDQSLERHTLVIARDGEVRGTVKTLEEDLPLVYGL